MSLYTQMKSEVIPNVMKALKLKNIHAAPSIKMVKVCVGIGSLAKQTKDFSNVVDNIAKITGQRPVITKSKIAVSNFKLRKGMPVGISVTLRGKRAHDFVEKLVHIVFPRVRDFRGISTKSFDGNGNYNIGFKEMLVFPEINMDDVTNTHGVQVTIVTSGNSDEHSRALLDEIGFPFKKEL